MNVDSNPPTSFPSARDRLVRLLRATRTRWRLRTLVRGASASLGVLAGGILLLAFLFAAGILPASTTVVLRWVPPVLAGLIFGASAIWAIVRAPSLEALALRVDEGGADDHLALTLLRLDPEHPYASELARRSEGRVEGLGPSSLLEPSLTRAQQAGAALLLGSAGFVVLTAGGPGALWAAHETPVLHGPSPTSVVQAGGDAFESMDPFAELLLRINPPAYTGLDPFELKASEGITALAGSRVQVIGAEDQLDARVIREGQEPEPLIPVENWRVEWVLGEGDRGLLLRSSPGTGRERILPVQVLRDGPPEVELLEPVRDLVLARGEGHVTFHARAQDAFGIDEFQLSWVHTRGGGESFDFREDSQGWTVVEETEDGVEGWLTLDLEELGIGPGEVLHLRATASDFNEVTGPGTGVSQTRQIRVIREGEEMQVDALLGFPLELAEEPILSQRMLLIMTEELLERADELTPDELARESGAIAQQQLRLRSQIGEQVFSRATGAMQPNDLHLGDHSHGDPSHEIAHLLHADDHDHGHDHDHTHDHDHGHDHGHDHDHQERSPPGSRYGVASIFDPSARPVSAQDTTVSTPHHPHAHGHSHGHDHDAMSPSEAGTDVGSVTIGGLGQLPTGFGEVNWIDHHHDGDPILSVNEPLLAIYNAMWESSRRLELVTPDASLPHQEEALAGLQALRENERVFARGRVSAPPVDVAEVRGTGSVDDVDPAPRSSTERVDRADRWIGQIQAAMGRIHEGETLELSQLAVAILTDGETPSAAGSHVVEADERLRVGDRDGALGELARVLRLLDARADRPERLHRPVRGSPSVTSSLLVSGRDRVVPESTPSGSETPDRDGGLAEEPFVFATLRYESGNWDSGPLVPQNLIHSLAQYTDFPVAPEGVVVDLSSYEIFRYPVLYLTGHIPVRFSEAESRNLKAYVERGGFVFMDDHNHDVDGAFHRTVTEELARIFGDDALQPLPNDHELYRAFFHFDDGPPTTSMELSGWGDGIIHPELKAIRINGRIGLLYSNKDYSSEWNYHAVNKRFLAVDNTRFGVNLLIYALTR